MDPTGMEGEEWDDIIFTDKDGNEIYRIEEDWFNDVFGIANIVVKLSDEQLEKGGFFAYAVEKGGATHSFVIDLTTGDYWEASYPRDENDKAKSLGETLDDNYENGEPKSVILERNVKKKDFWTNNAAGKPRGDLDVYVVWVPDRKKAIQYAKTQKENFQYNFITNNCKYWALSVLSAGGVHVDLDTKFNPIPAVFGYYIKWYKLVSSSVEVNKGNNIYTKLKMKR